MRLVRIATWAVVAAAAVVPGHTPLTSLREPHPATAAQAPERTMVAVPDLVSFDDLTPNAAAGLLPQPTIPSVVTLTTAKPARPPRTGVDGNSPAAGTPQAVLAAAYRKAVSRAPTGCHLQPAHLAAIGQVESGSIGGRSLTADHRVSPAIYGPLLDGGPFAVVRDSDGGAYDGAGDYDRAVGPLQFLPGTWSWAGRDGDGDGRRDPQNVFDAAMATADYLCRDGRDLARSGDLRAAVLSYNQSDAYHSAVVEWVSYFRRHGLAALTTVAFRVGSGGRASDLAVKPEPTEPPAPAKPGSAKPAKPATPALTSTPTAAPNGQPPPRPATPTTSAPTTTPPPAPPTTHVPPPTTPSVPAPTTAPPGPPPPTVATTP